MVKTFPAIHSVAKWMEIHVKGAKKLQLMLQDTFKICKKKNHSGACKCIAEV